MTNASEASRFRGEVRSVLPDGQPPEGFYAKRNYYVVVHVAPGGNGSRFLCRDGQLRGTCYQPDDSHPEGYYATCEEATFRLFLATDPRAALSPFLTARELLYVGTCHCGHAEKYRYRMPRTLAGPAHWRCAACDGSDSQFMRDNPLVDYTPKPDCEKCHGTGGPPDPLLLLMAADWFSDAGMELEASVLRSMREGEG